MTRGARAHVRLAAHLVPRGLRAAWTEEWLGELHGEAERLAAAGVHEREIDRRLRRIARGAWRDAVTLRRQGGAPPRPGREGRSALETLRREAGQALRALTRSRGLAFAAILTLALGIGAGTAVFSVVNGVLLRPLPFDDAAALVAIRPDRPIANREVAFLRDNARTLDDVAVVSPGWLVALTGVPDPAQLESARVTGNLFGMLGVEPVLGRTFGPEHETPGREPVAVLSHTLWRTRFGGDPAVLGRTLVLDRVPHTVIGVMPPTFEVLFVRPDVWTPFAMDRSQWTWTSAVGLGVARLAPGATAASATAELRALDVRMATEFGSPSDDPDPRVADLARQTVGDVRTPLLVLLGAVAFILLIACANVANLLLVRAAERRQELTVRVALGASRADVTRVLLLEGMLLALAGGLAGVLLAWAGAGALRALLPADTPRIASVAVDARVLLTGLAATLVAGVMFSAGPALLGGRGAVAARLRQGRTVIGGASAARGALIALEIALAVIVAAGAGLMARTLSALYSVDPGFRAERVLTLRMQPSGRDPDALRTYWRDVLESVRTAPGVVAAATVLHLPLAGRTWTDEVEIEGTEATLAQRPSSAWQSVSTGWFDAAGIPLRRGRDFASTDGPDAPLVAIVNDVFARTHFEDRDPVGRRIRTRNATGGEWATIVGVTGAVHHAALSGAPGPEIYVPFDQRTVVANGLFVRTSIEPHAVAPELRRRIRAIDPDVPVTHVQSMRELVDASLGRPRMIFTLLSAFAVLGVTLGAIGIAGVVAWVVRQRRREIGIRVALGASPAGVAALVARQGIAWAALGVAIGVPAALALSRLLQGMVFGVSTMDAVTFVAVPAGLLLIAALAGFLPARGAARVDPAEVLGE